MTIEEQREETSNTMSYVVQKESENRGIDSTIYKSGQEDTGKVIQESKSGAQKENQDLQMIIRSSNRDAEGNPLSH